MSATATVAAPALPRLLLGAPTQGALSLADHIALHGKPPGGAGGRAPLAELVAEVERAGLTGRGGAAFPTAVKMRAVADAARGARARRPAVVINAVEAEPPSHKDRTLLEAVPHLVLDGGSLAAQALGARDAIVCVGEAAHTAHASVARAIRERRRALDGGVTLHLAAVPARYVAGEESALVSYLSGGAAKPSFTPPLPAQRGVDGRPTLVNNAETLAQLALIARHGAQWFRALGTPARPGSALVTLHGPVAHPGVYEIEHGSSLQSLVLAAGGAERALVGALVGGYAGTWVSAAEARALALDDDALAQAGARLGAGVVALLGDDACPLGETVRLARWLASEGARQCGPCEHGLPALAGTLEEAIAGGARQPPGQRIAELAQLVSGRGACGHPDGAARLVTSVVAAFPEALEEHMRYGPCPACLRPGVLPLPAHAARPLAPRPRAGARVVRRAKRSGGREERARPARRMAPRAPLQPASRARVGAREAAGVAGDEAGAWRR